MLTHRVHEFIFIKTITNTRELMSCKDFTQEGVKDITQNDTLTIVVIAGNHISILHDAEHGNTAITATNFFRSDKLLF